MGTVLKKDLVLAEIADRGGNVAQFYAVDEQGKQVVHRIRHVDTGHTFSGVEEAVRAIGTVVNVRCYTYEKPDGNPFDYGKPGQTPEQVAKLVAKRNAQGYRCIINEQVSVRDGGFSGVLHGDVAEFASLDTPRCVDNAEKGPCAVVPRSMLAGLIRTVYRNAFSIPYDRNHRVEFSVHPGPVGYLQQSHLVWQVERMDASVAPGATLPLWPNRYSQDMGDKAYGLLMAYLLGYDVPRTSVWGRIIPEFTFGNIRGSRQVRWIRTCPRKQEPGRFLTQQAWLDLFHYMQNTDPVCVHESCEYTDKGCTDPQHRMIASVLAQEAIEAKYSGACITNKASEPVIEGIPGKGDPFMVGDRAGEHLPNHIMTAVRGVWESATGQLGPVRFEWVCDRDDQIVIVQFHRGSTSTFGDVLVEWEREPIRWEVYRTEWGLERFRLLCEQAATEGFGIILETNLGVTNHFVDNLRRHRVPSRRQPLSAE